MRLFAIWIQAVIRKGLGIAGSITAGLWIASYVFPAQTALLGPTLAFWMQRIALLASIILFYFASYLVWRDEYAKSLDKSKSSALSRRQKHGLSGDSGRMRFVNRRRPCAT